VHVASIGHGSDSKQPPTTIPAVACTSIMKCTGLFFLVAAVGVHAVTFTPHAANKLQVHSDEEAILSLMHLPGSSLDKAATSLVAEMTHALLQQEPSSHQPSVDIVNSTVHSLLSGLQSQWDTQLRSLNTSAFAACSSTMQAEQQKHVAEETVEYKQCLAELEALNVSALSCPIEEEALKQAEEAACQLFNEHDRPWFQLSMQSCSEQFSGTYKEWLDEKIEFLSFYRSLSKNCTDLKDAAAAKPAECINRTALFEDKQAECSALAPDWCGVHALRVQACSTYETCWSQASSSYELSLNTFRELEKNMKAEYRSLMRINCLIQVLGDSNDNETNGTNDASMQTNGTANHTVSNFSNDSVIDSNATNSSNGSNASFYEHDSWRMTKLEECIAEDHSSSFWNHTVPEIPPKPECAAGERPAFC